MHQVQATSPAWVALGATRGLTLTMPCLPCVQKGKKAKAPTAQEFLQDVLAPAVKEGRESVQPLLDKVRGRPVQVKHSFDNTAIHEAGFEKQDFEGLLQQMGWHVGMRFPLSKYSPDLHQVIEHTHARATAAFSKWLYWHPGKRSPEVYREQFERLYKQQCTKEIIAADVHNLPNVYNWVKDHHGDWAPRALR